MTALDGKQLDDAGDRARLIAELASRLASIESRATESHAVESRAIEGTSATGPTGTGRGRTPAATGPALPTGSSGTTSRQPKEPGGHPEDALGDPEAVAKAICLRLLTGAARPRAGLASALRQRGIPRRRGGHRCSTASTEVGLIDDQAYADAFVAAKHRDRALGATALRTELRRKGVDEVIVDAAVRAVDQDAERERARALIARRVDAAMAKGAVAARRRLVGLLARRGYSAEMAGRVVDEALTEYGARAETRIGHDWTGCDPSGPNESTAPAAFGWRRAVGARQRVGLTLECVSLTSEITGESHNAHRTAARPIAVILPHLPRLVRGRTC